MAARAEALRDGLVAGSGEGLRVFSLIWLTDERPGRWNFPVGDEDMGRARGLGGLGNRMRPEVEGRRFVCDMVHGRALRCR